MLRVTVLTSNPWGNAARVAHYIVRALPNVEIVGAIIDTGSRPDRRRQIARLRAWHQWGGVSYATWRLYLLLRPTPFRDTGRARYHCSLQQMGEEFGFPVTEVTNVNDPSSARVIRGLSADVGVSIGNRVIAPAIFEIPPLGIINLHHGKIPDFRGGPPGFWELQAGAKTMGVSVHRIDTKLDHGELLAQGDVSIRADDAPRTIMERAYDLDYRLVANVLSDLDDGSLIPIAVSMSGSTANTIPSRAELKAVRARVGRHLWPDDFRFAPLTEIPVPPRGRDSKRARKEGTMKTRSDSTPG